MHYSEWQVTPSHLLAHAKRKATTRRPELCSRNVAPWTDQVRTNGLCNGLNRMRMASKGEWPSLLVEWVAAERSITLPSSDTQSNIFIHSNITLPQLQSGPIPDSTPWINHSSNRYRSAFINKFNRIHHQRLSRFRDNAIHHCCFGLRRGNHRQRPGSHRCSSRCTPTTTL